MLHIVLHFVVPLVVAGALFRSRWWSATLLMLMALVIDLDHLLADPIYDPLRCSIGFHPLHSVYAISVYVLLFFLSLPHLAGQRIFGSYRLSVNLIAIGLVVHIVLDSLDCVF